MEFDVESDTLLVRVDNGETPVNIAAVRELTGVATTSGRGSAFFAIAGYTAQATSFAEETNFALVLGVCWLVQAAPIGIN